MSTNVATELSVSNIFPTFDFLYYWYLPVRFHFVNVIKDVYHSISFANRPRTYLGLFWNRTLTVWNTYTFPSFIELPAMEGTLFVSMKFATYFYAVAFY